MVKGPKIRHVQASEGEAYRIAARVYAKNGSGCGSTTEEPYQVEDVKC
jgi:hypothetical protein